MRVLHYNIKDDWWRILLALAICTAVAFVPIAVGHRSETECGDCTMADLLEKIPLCGPVYIWPLPWVEPCDLVPDNHFDLRDYAAFQNCLE